MRPIGEGEMTIERVRVRACITCLLFIRNIAYVRAFAATSINDTLHMLKNNSLDIAVLEWCKIFADERNGKHYWTVCISEAHKERATAQILSESSISEDEFKSEVSCYKRYRDKFIAHLDHENTLEIPSFDKGLALIKNFYTYILENEELPDSSYKSEAPDVDGYYNYHFGKAKELAASVSNDSE